MKVGDTIYCFDSDYRVCDQSPGASRGPIYREYWRPEIITGETVRSWLVGEGPRGQVKVDKKTMLTKQDYRGYRKRYVANLMAVEHDVWVHENRRRLSSAIDHCSNFGTLRKIADVLNDDGVKWEGGQL